MTNPYIKHQEDTNGTDRVLLFGETLIDDFGYQRMIGGAQFNVARHLRAFGLHPSLVSRVGDDTDGDEIMAALERFGIDIDGIHIDSDHPTGNVRVHMQGNGHTFEILPGQAYDFIDGEEAKFIATRHPPQLIYFGTLAQRGEVSKNALQALLDNVDAPRIVDLNLREPWFDSETTIATLHAADILKLNKDELESLSLLLGLSGNNTREQAEILMARFPIKKLLLTEGALGAWLFNADATRSVIVGHPSLRVTDTVGAGDAFTAVLIFGLLRGWPDRLILERADEFAQAICRIHEAIPMQDGFYQHFLMVWS